MSMVPLYALSRARPYQCLRRVFSPRFSCNFRPSSGLIPRSISISLFTIPADHNFFAQMGLYADRERGRYAVWQSLDHEKYFPGSGIIFVTVTVRVVFLFLPTIAHSITFDRATSQNALRLFRLRKSKLKFCPYSGGCTQTSPCLSPWTSTSIAGTRIRCSVDHIPTGLRRS